MRCLFLDLASHSGLLACVDDHVVIASQAIDHRIGDHELVPIFEQILKSAGWKHRDLTHAACVVGPGGFTSLRVAVAFANTLMHALTIPGAGVHLSALYATRVLPQYAVRSTQYDGGFLWLHSTKKHELFVRGFGAYAKVWPETSLLSLEEFAVRSTQYAVRFWTGELISEHESLVREKGMLPLALTPLEKILPEFLAHQTFTAKLLEPWYGREG